MPIGQNNLSNNFMIDLSCSYIRGYSVCLGRPEKEREAVLEIVVIKLSSEEKLYHGFLFLALFHK